MQSYSRGWPLLDAASGFINHLRVAPMIYLAILILGALPSAVVGWLNWKDARMMRRAKL